MCESVETWVSVIALLVAIIVGSRSLVISKQSTDSSTLNDFLTIYKALNVSSTLNLLTDPRFNDLKSFFNHYKNEISQHKKFKTQEFLFIYDVVASAFYQFTLTHSVIKSLRLPETRVVPIIFEDIAKYRTITDPILEYMKKDALFEDGISKYCHLRSSSMDYAKKNGLKF